MACVNVAVIGASGAVGKEMIRVLCETKFPVDGLFLFASEKSANVSVSTAFGDLTIQPYSLQAVLAAKVKIALVAVSGDFSLAELPLLADNGILCVDNSSAFRYDEKFRLVVPPVNGERLLRRPSDQQTLGWRQLIVANPNCTTAILALVLAPLARQFGGLDIVIVASYQAASGAGERGIQQLQAELAETNCTAAAGQAGTGPNRSGAFKYALKCNVIPAIDVFTGNGYTKEEMKLPWETRKLLDDPTIKISATCVRVPTMRAHAVAATVKTRQPCLVGDVRKCLELAAEAGGGFDIVDDIDNDIYPMPLTATNKYNVQVGRIRQSLVFADHGIDLFVVGDQLLRGAALNAVEIARMLF